MGSQVRDALFGANVGQYSALAFSSGGYIRSEGLRSPAWNAQRLPFRRAEMFAQEDDLPDVVRVVRDLAIDGLHHRMRFTANGHFT